MMTGLKGTLTEAAQGKNIGQIMREKDKERKDNRGRRNREYLDEITEIWEIENKQMTNNMKKIQPDIREWAKKNEHPSDGHCAFVKQVKRQEEREEKNLKFKLPT